MPIGAASTRDETALHRVAETAHVLGSGTTTVEDDWHMAKAWLARELKKDSTS